MRSRSLTHLVKLMCLSAVVLGLTVATASPVWAATYCDFIAQDPEIPYPTETVRIWMNSNTDPGETAIVEYHIIDTETYVTVTGTLDNTSYQGANWYADIPALPTGTQVEYQLMTHNPSGNSCSPTDFNWSYTVSDPQYVAQLPVTPIYTQSPRVWISSTITSTGEAGVILDQPGGPITYTGAYSSTGYLGANWYVDLPLQSVGTLVTYRFYSDNHSGPFNASSGGRNYTVADLPDDVYVDDLWAGSIPGSDLGQPGADNFGGNAFATVQGGVTGVAPGRTVHVNAGLYTENIVITKALTLAGVVPSDTIVIRPAVSNPNCSGGPLCDGAASNIILVQADNVTIHSLTLDGDNLALTDAIIDARNGIIENNAPDGYDGLTVYDTTIRNIYLRGLSASSGGDNFDLHDNTVQNVQGDTTTSVAIINEGGSGRIANNTISQAANAIAANGSRGTSIQYNTVTTSGRGVHTNNNGGSGGTADVLEWNNVSDCTTGGYGVWVFAPARDVSVHHNTITGCAVGLAVAVAGQNAPVAPAFFYNEVNGQSLPNSTGIYVTTNQLGVGSHSVSASFDHNAIANTATGIDLEQEIDDQLTTTFTNHSLISNTTGLEMTGGNVTFAGNNVVTGTTAITQSGGALLAYANNFIRYTTPVTRSGGTATANLAHNWWSTYIDQPAGVSDPDWRARLGAQLVALDGYVVWAEGVGAAALDNVSLSGGTGTAVIIDHGHSDLAAPFGNVRFNNMCSGYFDFFIVNGGGSWSVSVPVDGSPEECLTQTLNPGRIYWIPAGTDYAADCIAPNNENPDCWELIATNVITGGQNITVTGLITTALGGTQFVAGSTTGSDPTAVAIVGFAATTDRSTAPVGIILVGAVITAASIILVTRRRR